MRVRKKLLARLDERKLKWLLAAFFVALAVPAATLIGQAYRQLGWEAFRSDQLLAEALAARIDAELAATVAAEEARSFADYSFLVVAGDVAANFVQRSPLSTFPLAGAPPGALGYFQIDADGVLTSPLLPAAGSNIDAASYGIGADEARARAEALASLRGILAANRLTPRAVAVRDVGAELDDGADESSSSLFRRNVSTPAASSSASSPQPSAALATQSRQDRQPQEPQSQGLRVPPGRSQGPSSTTDSSPIVPAAAATGASGGFVPVDAAADDAPTLLRDGGQASVQRASDESRLAVDLERREADIREELNAALRGMRAPPPLETPQLSQEAFDIKFGANASGLDAVPVASFAEKQELQAAARDDDAPISRQPTATAKAERVRRMEQGLSAEAETPAANAAAAAGAGKTEVKVGIFESELDPFDVGWLETGHFVLFRNAWRDGHRYIQGLLVDERAFLEEVVAAPYRRSKLANSAATLVVLRGGSPIAQFTQTSSQFDSVSAPPGVMLQRARLSPPYGDLELGFFVDSLARATGAGASLLAWTSIVLAAVLVAGFLLMYRFAVGQLRLTRQQQDFVSAVSHELKTPLTSIRMYGEMLKAGWVDEAKRATYYDYIHGESERLSRLIENVLQLARLTRSTQRFDLKRVGAAELLDLVRSKAATQVERAGFTLELRNDAGDAAITVDADCFTQIAINLVDNALKFAAGAERKAVVIACRRESGGTILFTVRDFGPGIPKGQMRKIFELFYRPADGLTRETAGTGIGLALVKQLTTAMGGRIDVRNCEPGAEFRLSFASEAR